jgi:hypothetical protein
MLVGPGMKRPGLPDITVLLLVTLDEIKALKVY